MAMPPKASVELRDFAGMMDVDPRDLEPGAAEVQVNACCLVMGELTVRRGYQQVQFEDD